MHTNQSDEIRCEPYYEAFLKVSNTLCNFFFFQFLFLWAILTVLLNNNDVKADPGFPREKPGFGFEQRNPGFGYPGSGSALTTGMF